MAEVSQRHRDGADALSLPYQVRQHPAALAQLQGIDLEHSELPPAQRAADWQRQDHVVPFAFEGQAVGYCEQLPGLARG